MIGILSPLFPEDFSDDFEDFPITEAEGITVTGTPETTQQIKTITKEEIERVNAPDLPALLEQTLDLGVTRRGPYGNEADINIRGFDSERIAILIDGMPVNSPLDGDFDFTMIDVNSIEKIEVVYGGSDTKYNVSGALGGVINIITVKKQKPGFRMGAGLSNTSTLPGAYYNRDNKKDGPRWQDLFDTQKITLSAGMGMERFSWSAHWFANRAENHYIFKDPVGTVRRRDSNEVLDTGINASLVWDLPEYTKLIFNSSFYYGDKNFPIAPISPSFNKQIDFLTRQNVLLDMPRIFRDDLATEAGLNYSLQTLDYDSSLHKVHTITAVNRWSWYPGIHPLEKFTLRAGVDYRLSYLDSTDMGVNSRHDGGLYLTAEYQAHNSFLVVPSVKGIFAGKGSTIPAIAVPKLGLLWTPTDFLTIKNNYFRSFKHPDFEDLYWGNTGLYKGNPDLKSEDGWGGDLGLTYRQKKYLSAGTTFYAQWTSDSIHWSAGPGSIWQPQNVGEAAFFGSENRVTVTVPFTEIGLSLSYQFLLGYLLSYGYTWESDKRIPYMPLHTLGFALDIPWALGKSEYAGSMTISGHYETARFADTANQTRLDPYFLLNININQVVNKNIVVFLAVNNVLNTLYQSFYSYPMPGLTVTLGMRMNYEHQ
jgi:vitamin B12 transporter